MASKTVDRLLDLEFLASPDPFYRALGRLSESAHSALESHGSNSIEWLAFVDFAADFSGSNVRERWEDLGVLPEGYRSLRAEIEAFRAGNPDYIIAAGSPGFGGVEMLA
jgi:hypothetical protein